MGKFKEIIILMNDDGEPTENFLDNRLGYSALQKLGYCISVFCIMQNNRNIRYAQNYNIFFLKNEKELGVALSNKNNKEVLILSILLYDFFSYRIYRVISKLKFEYCAYLMSGWTCELKNSGFRQLRYELSFDSLKKTISTFKKISHIRRLVYDLFPHIPSFLLGVSAPKYALCAGLDSLKYSFWYPINQKTKTIWGHYWDYEKYLNTLNDKIESTTYGDKIVFVDQKLAEDPVINQNLKIDKSQYYASLEDFFVFLEKKYNVRIVVAAHPFAQDGYYTDCFGGKREIVSGETDKAIMRSKAVILHASNSRTFAVLFKKPIIFVLNNESSRHADFYADTIWSAAMLGKNVVNIDSKEELTAFDLEKELAIDAKKYEEYKEKYIKTKHSENKSVWRIFHEEISEGD